LQVATNLVTLQTCLTKMMGKPISMDQLHQDVGTMVEKITKVIAGFRQLQLRMEEYVCLKVISMVYSEGNITYAAYCDHYYHSVNMIKNDLFWHYYNQPSKNPYGYSGSHSK